jgi:hypothetical protein
MPNLLRFETVPVADEEKGAAVGAAAAVRDFSTKEETERNFLLMSIAYAANIGKLILHNVPQVYYKFKGNA